MTLTDIPLIQIPPFCDLTDEQRHAEIAKFGEDSYKSHCVPGGSSSTHALHDGLTVTFYADRYEHAFYTSSDRARRAHDKDVIAPSRIERLPWILPMIGGQVAGIICKEATSGQKKRVYFSNEPGYVIWLNPTKTGNWRFSSAYPIPPAEIAKSTHGFKTIWRSR